MNGGKEKRISCSRHVFMALDSEAAEVLSLCPLPSPKTRLIVPTGNGARQYSAFYCFVKAEHVFSLHRPFPPSAPSMNVFFTRRRRRKRSALLRGPLVQGNTLFLCTSNGGGINFFHLFARSLFLCDQMLTVFRKTVRMHAKLIENVEKDQEKV